MVMLVDHPLDFVEVQLLRLEHHGLEQLEDHRVLDEQVELLFGFYVGINYVVV